MTGYDLTIKMRKARRKHPLTSTEQALFYELVAICNEMDWEDVFTASNDELCIALNVSENTLNVARMALINAKLIYYASGKSKRQYSQYSFTKKLTTSKFDTKAATNPSTNPATVDGVNPSTVAEKTTSNSEDYSKPIDTVLDVETETKPITLTGDGAPEDEKKIKTPHWVKMKEVWIDFYKERKDGFEPTFNAAGATALKSILSRLQKFSSINQKSKDKDWTEEYATRVFTHFLMRAYSDEWRAQNFRLPILSSHYDSIITGNEHKPNSKAGRAEAANANLSGELAEHYANLSGQG